MVQENCYVVSDETKEALILDCGAFFPQEHEAIDSYIQCEGLKLCNSICTHGHFDHTLGLGHIYNKYGIKPQINAKDAELYTNLPLQIQQIMGASLPVETAPLGTYLSEGNIVSIGHTSFRVIETPGHTPGGVCLYCAEEKALFSGDSLFELSIGRTDFPGGDFTQLISGLKTKILTLPADTVVYSGHGNTTTIGSELRSNPYLQ